MATTPEAPSEETREDLAVAFQQVQGLALLGEFDWAEFPERLIESALARDGEERVIGYLADLAARAAREATAISGRDPQEAIGRFAELVGTDEPPSTLLAWSRACDAVLRLFGPPLQVTHVAPVEPVDPVGVVAALLGLRALGRFVAVVWKQDPDLMAEKLAARRTDGDHSPTWPTSQ